MATPIHLARAPIDPANKLECVSYAPFRADQSPLDPTTQVPSDQIEQDLRQLAAISKCVRTYSIENGLHAVPPIAARLGLKVMQGIWLGSDRLKNQQQIATAVALAKDYPGVVTSLVVGNEVLLRGEMTATDLVGNIRLVKSQVANLPVTYADVWEYWLKNREIYEVVDFITIHILPYWEDFPIPARQAAAHVEQIRKRVAIAFPNKEILIGETGWPSAGRMREGALPSRANQARVVSEILVRASQQGYRVNLIEAYDQPWKRALEGTVGGHWGLFGAETRSLKYPAGVAVSNFPGWKAQLAAGIILCLLTFSVAAMTLRRRPWAPRRTAWIAVALSATVGGILLGVAEDRMMVESLGLGGWLRWGALLIAGCAAPLLCANALMSGRSPPAFVEIFGPKEQRTASWPNIALGIVLLVAVLIAVETALGFAFDPRYRDFPFASLTMVVVPLASVILLHRSRTGTRPIAEAVFAGLLLIAAAYTAFNEGAQNWQALWTCGIYALLAFTLWQVRVARSPG